MLPHAALPDEGRFKNNSFAGNQMSLNRLRQHKHLRTRDGGVFGQSQ
jgi:hypothetical protein